MAQAIICDVCETAAADFLVTNLIDGQTFAACGVDFFHWCGAMASHAEPAEQPPQPETPPGDVADTQGEGADVTSPDGQPKSESETPPDETEGAGTADVETAGSAHD